MEASELETKEIGILDSYRSRAVVGCIITFTITSSVSIILRLMAKRMNKTKLYAEDWVILAAQVGRISMSRIAGGKKTMLILVPSSSLFMAWPRVQFLVRCINS